MTLPSLYMGTRLKALGKLGLCLCIVLWGLLFCARMVVAGANSVVDFDIPAASADVALTLFARQANLQLLYRFDSVSQLQVKGLKGQYIVEQGARQLLAGTCLEVVFKDDNTLLIKDHNNYKEPTMSATNCSYTTFTRFKKSLLALLVGSASIAGHAQEDGARSSLMEEVVVTARKKAVGESVQDTPLAMTVFGEQQFKAIFADNLSDLGNLSPNVEMKPASNVGVQNFTIRGMGVSGTTPSDSPAVGVFQNGVFWGTNYGSLLDTFDIESVEILRGPQGTLFGRNVTGGAVVVKTKRPGEEFGLAAEAKIGSYGRRDFSLGVEAAVAANLAARLVVLESSLDGYFTNVVNGKDYGRSDTRLIRGTLVFSPSDDFDASLILENYDSDGSSVAAVGIEVPGNLPYTVVGYRQPSNLWDLRLDNPGEAENQVESALVELNWSLAHGAVTSVSGYRNVLVDHYTDFDGSEYSGFNRSLYMDQSQFSEELRYASTFSDTYEFTIGAYYFTQEQDYREGRDIGGGGVPHSAVFAAGSHLDQSSWALFGELDYNLSDSLTATLGGRFTSETIEAQTVPFGVCPLDTTLPNPQRIRNLSLACDLGPTAEQSWSDFSPKLGVSWAIDNAQLAYASVTKGFRSGGYSMRGNNILPPFDSEQVIAYELGYKGDLLENQLRVNAALFINEYSDLQRTILVPDGQSGVTQSTGNAAEATIKGFELELTYQALDQLVFTLAYGYTDAGFDEYRGFEVDGIAGISGADAQLAKRLKFTRVPENTYSASANYSMSLADLGDIDWRLALTQTDSVYFDDLNTIVEPDYTIWDASATFNHINQRWQLALYGKNLGNEEYAYWGSNLGSLGQNRFVGAPRTYGIRIGYVY